MTIVEDPKEPEKAKQTQPAAEVDTTQQSDGDNKEEMFSQENVASDTKVSVDAPEAPPEISTMPTTKDIVITTLDKASFIDSVVSNTRFEKSYKLFGGRLNITLRSLTMDETNAMSAWAIKQSVVDPSWHISGRGRKYLLSAHVAKLNGMDIPPLHEPLFETLEKDGKSTKEPGWVETCSFWDDKGTAIIDAIIKCIADFDARYKILCDKAEDENFWAPDTP